MATRAWPSTWRSPEVAELEAVRRETVLRDAVGALPAAIEALPARQRALMRMLSVVPTPSYHDVARELSRERRTAGSALRTKARGCSPAACSVVRA